MSRVRAVVAIARADLLERVRRSSFLAILAATAWLGWLVVRGQVTLRLDTYAGAVNGAWAAALVAVTLSAIVSLAGFWVVKGSVGRDRTTRVGEILAATPLSNAEYAIGKFLSNFAVLGAIVAVLAVAAPVLVLLSGRGMHPASMLSPFFLIALPSMAVVAALAVLFETFRPLSGGAGNILWFFLWTALLAVPFAVGSPEADVSGLQILYESMGSAAKASFPDYRGGFSLTVVGLEDQPVRGTFIWNGIDWTPGMIASRCAWFGIAALIALLAAVPFDRFDDSRRRKARTPGRALEDPEGRPGTDLALTHRPAPARLTPLAASSASFSDVFLRVYLGELRLMLKGLPWWSWAAAAGLVVASVAAPFEIARARILPFAWIWPVLVWSAMGAREARDGTEELVFSAPHSLAVQLPALYLSGVTIALAAGAGVGIRCVASGSLGAFAGWLSGAFFIPALALALGTWSGTSKVFEAVYTVLWYIGPLQPTPALDFMGASDAGIAAGMPAVTLIVAATLIGAAIIGRRLRNRR